MGVIPVPSPAKLKRTPLWKVMGVKSKDDPGLAQLMRHILSLCHIYLNMKLSYTKQPRDALKRITDEAVRTFPELQKYANYWPVKEIIRNKLYDSKRNLSQKKKKQSAACKPSCCSFCERPSLGLTSSGGDRIIMSPGEIV
ncbi:hypothetical protein NLI96_g5178 [Meripilus lineatus]|uniref:Uncharacterized protein n=1 Tax=Meripilus lineatus TaxID=2056292 RepID=A0AAD5YJD7_9APHY|nr:hypothetical protein NLI96_g5178 [Physisporinus lineatus]